MNLDEKIDRPLKIDSLKPEWNRFAWAVARGESPQEAYQGIYKCEDESARVGAWRLLREATIQEALDEIQRELYVANIGTLRGLQAQAIGVLRAIILKSNNDEMRLRAATQILDRTGITTRQALELDMLPKRAEDSLDSLLSGEDDEEPHGTACPA